MTEFAELRVLFEDEHFIAIDKPSGMLVHRSKMDAREQVFAVQTLRDQIGQHVFPVHRLDKPTSGILMFGKDPDAARAFSEILQLGQAAKNYTAIVRGWTLMEDRIDYALQELLDKTTDSKARRDKPPQEAVTSYLRKAKVEVAEPVGRYETARYSLLEVRPETGRKHQLRRHLKHIFHPIIGDRKYGDRDHNAFFRMTLGIDRLMLAATGLDFSHPFTGQSVHIQAETGFPEEILRLFSKAG